MICIVSFKINDTEPYCQQNIIIKPRESGELCEEIIEFVVVEGDLPPPQTK